MSLHDLPPSCATSRRSCRCWAGSDAVLAVPEPARAFAVAGLAQAVRAAGRCSSPCRPRPTPSGWPTTWRPFLGPEAGRAVPGVGDAAVRAGQPGVETMGRRLRTMWRLRTADQRPDGRGRAGAGPGAAARPARRGRRAGRRPARRPARPDELVERLVAAGYRREYQVEHRGEVAVRGSIVDVFPSTADAPVRIDLWGDEVDRLTEFSVADQRSTGELAEVEIFPCRELLPTDEVRARADRLVGLEPWGREQWERLAEGLTFDGMESWLPWLTDDEHLLFDLLPADAQVLLVEPRRMRDRAADIARRGGRPRRHAWPRPGAPTGTDEHGPGFPPLHLPFDRLLAHTDGAGVDGHQRARGSRRRRRRGAGAGTRSSGDGDAAGRQLRRALSAQGYAGRRRRRRRGLGGPASRRLLGDARGRRRRIEVAPLERGFILPRSSSPCSPRPTHRPAPRPPAGPAPPDATPSGSSTTSSRATTSCTTTTASPATAAWSSGPSAASSATTCCSSTGATTSSTSRPTRSTPSATTPAARRPTLSRLGGSDWHEDQGPGALGGAGDRPGAGRPLPEAGEQRRATPFPDDTPWQRELEDAFPYQETPDQLRPSTT